MTDSHDPCTLGLGPSVDYLLGELAEEDAARLEMHLFECDACAEKIVTVERIGRAVADVARDAAVGANVNEAFLKRAARDGLTMREYRIPAGETVACTAGPEDLVVVRLAADFGEASELSLDVTFHNLESGEVQAPVTRWVSPDRNLGEVILVFPGELVRTYPRSRWNLEVSGELPSGREGFGSFVMDHSP